MHKYITGSTPPAGWHQQLKARPGLQLSVLEIQRWGNTPYGRSQIDKKALVPSAELGLSLPLQRWAGSPCVPRLMLTHTVRGAVFKSRAGPQPGPARYGNVTLYWDFQPAGK